MSEVRPAAPTELRALSLVLSRAFREDPVHRWILPEEFDWSLLSAAFFASVTRDALRNESVYTTAGQEAVALWMPPYPKPVSRRERVTTAAGWFLALGRRGLPLGEQLERLEEARPLEPHWYLAVLGTDPRHQGRGHAAALLRERLAHCDEERLPAYLESSRAENLPFYERFGFRVEASLDLEGGPTVWRMLRRPAQAAQQASGG
ncbi:MAG: GNAT family N-acetyltransferase [Myxococcota bacterium]